MILSVCFELIFKERSQYDGFLFLCECFLINVCPSVKTVRLIWATGGWNRKWREREGVLKLIAVAGCDGTACDGPPVWFGTEPRGKSECVCFTSFGKPRDTICNAISFLLHFLQHILVQRFISVWPACLFTSRVSHCSAHIYPSL